ncbi:AAA family ATPase [Candidatus Bathyarchaeota archaeon]|nr:AAA family ATPase [Candidatus Bathyarchaeota archaeon]
MVLKDRLIDPSTRFLLFGGKGGVGKTSSAACAAVWTAENTDKSVLIVSTDPAHSLSDSLGVPMEPGVVMHFPEIGELYGLEISPNKRMEEIQSVMGGGMGMGDMEGMNIPMLGELGDLASMNPPGVDEAMAFGKVLEFVENSEYDLVIFDTAPTGHTLRLLSLPEVLSGWIGKLMMLRLRLGKFFGAIKNMFKRDKDEQDDSLEMIKHLKESIEAAKEELEDPAKTSFIIVMIAEEMAIYETERLLSSLITYNIPVHHIVVNQLYPEIVDCDFCASRRDFQRKHMKGIMELYGEEFDVISVPLFEREIRKFEQLRRMASYIVEGNHSFP